MVLKSIYLLPHGGIIVPESEPGRNDQADILHEEMMKVAQEIKDDDIQLIFLTSPHGYSHPSDYLIYLHDVFEGMMEADGINAIYNQSLKDENDTATDEANTRKTMQQLLFQGNVQVAQVLYQVLKEAKLPASPLVLADPNYPLKLAWGELIPLVYLNRLQRFHSVIFSIPMIVSITENPENVLNELSLVGKNIQMIADSPMLEKINVAVVISGDLSHKHDKDHAYGFHESAEKFDELAQEWSVTPSQENWLELQSLQEDAASCGLYGIGVIQGVIDSSEKTWINQKAVYARPSYFGMMVASWKLDEG